MPGAFVNVKVNVGSKKQIIKVPQVSLVYSADGYFVYKIVDGKAVKAKIEIGERTDKDAIIKSGVSLGDVIVTAGQLKLNDGAVVKVVSNE